MTNIPYRIAFGSIAVGVLVLGLKVVAFLLTGSVALYSDALESVINVATAVMALWALWWGARPADPKHPYGHHKIEYVAAVAEGVLIVLAALSILRAAWFGFLNPRPLDAAAHGLAVSLVATIINAAWAQVLIRAGRRHRSPVLVADGHHLMTDVFTTIGVLAGLLATVFTGWHVLDPLLAAAVAIGILLAGWGVMKGSFGGLLDEAISPAEQERIHAVISEVADGALQAHDIRTRQAGRATFIDFHLVVPGGMTVDCAHDICDRIENALRAAVPGARIAIHIEPETKAKEEGAVEI